MYLKSLEIQGFKSFANKIDFKFHNGITGIVGPNGSGKSNVGDAVRWVLGEQSAKQLRGANMQDVIFSGTENRKPLGFASVAITLDNADHELPVEYGEVTVSRRVYRSGESEYRLNGTTCRLKDIQELFYDTGIGKEGYSIIGQGQIDKILSGRPEERRELFDEAAGIVKFKRRKAAACKKLEDERANLVRVNDILTELERQLVPLKRQAEQAKIYLKKKEELKKVDLHMFLLEMERMEKELSETEEKYRIAKEQLQSLKKEYEKEGEKYKKQEKDLEALDQVIDQLKEEEKQSELFRQQMAGQIGVLQEQIRAAIQQKQQMQERKIIVEEEISKKEIQKQQEEENLLKWQEFRKQAAAEEADFKLEADATTALLTHLERQMEDGKNEIIHLLNQRASVKGKVQRYDTMQEQVQIRKAEVTNKLLRIGSEDARQNDILSQSRRTYEEVSVKIEKLLDLSKEQEQHAQELQQMLTEQNRKLEQNQSAYHREASRLETLTNLTERYDGYGNSIRRVMEQKTKESGIVGVVADLIKTDKKYETAIETALGGSIQNIVTEDEDTAKRMITFLKKNRYGRATFLPLTAVGRKGTAPFREDAKKEPGILGIASELVQTDDRYHALIHYLLGRTLVADHIDHAIAVARKYQYSLRIVTLEGESFSPGGSMTGGAFKNSSNLLGRRREVEELQKRVTALKGDLEKQQRQIDENRRKRSGYREKIVELNEQLQKSYVSQNTARMEIRQMEEKLDESKGELARLRTESADLDAQLVQIKQEKHLINEAVLDSEKQEKMLQEQIEAWQKEQEIQRIALEKQNGKTESLRLKLAEARQQEVFAKQNIRRVAQEIKDLQSEQLQIGEKAQKQEEHSEEKKVQIRKTEEQIRTEEERAKERSRKLKMRSEEREEKGRVQKTFFARQEEFSGQISGLDKECYRLSSIKEKMEETKDGRISAIWDEYQVTPSEADAWRDETCGNLTQAGKRINEIKTEIRALGNVNVNAIEDYKEMSRRHDFLQNQHDDLVKAEKALEEIIAELDTGMRKQFQENFARIQAEFDKTFRELFGGGRGTLELVEGEDVLEAGIRIISQPPGKKLQNMMQLSGGEKALTAIALLFAIQHLKPSPFCLLDEIEAALDEANVSRYANYLHKLTKNTQFIIITHRRGTMAAADRLYGITMQEKGVSALVSVNLIEEELEQ
jgi:chromosome segregation protein